MPAIALAKQIVDEGRLGRIFHYRACYLQDWTISPDLPAGGQTLWRLDKEVAGSGVTGDLISHSVDTAIWLNGPMTRVVGDTETFIKQRASQDAPGEVKEIGIDDACQFLGRFANGSMALFESTRYARGNKNRNGFEINGADGSDPVRPGRPPPSRILRPPRPRPPPGAGVRSTSRRSSTLT